MTNQNTVICFCKHPEPGMVKSRLAADLGEKQAADIYERLLNKTLSNITQNIQETKFRLFLYCYPDTKHPALSIIEANYTLTLKQQSDGHLGDKMYQAINNHLSSNSNVVLIGTDCIEIDSSYITNAFKALETGNKIVLGPTCDGGYALIGASEINQSIFDSIDWSTSKVLEQTIMKLQNLEWNFSCLSKVRDLDRLEDYQYYSNHHKYSHIFN